MTNGINELIARVADPQVATDELHRQLADALAARDLVISALVKAIYDEWPPETQVYDIVNGLFLSMVTEKEKAAILAYFPRTTPVTRLSK